MSKQIWQQGVLRGLGIKETPAKLKGSFTSFRSRPASLPRSSWTTVDYRHCAIRPGDTKGFFACGGFSAAKLLEYHRELHNLPRVALSGMFAYALACDGKNEGVVLATLMDAVQQLGVCRDELWPKEQYRLTLSNEVREDAAKHRLAEVYQCRTFDDFVTALTLNGPCLLGLRIGSNVGRLDKDGVLPYPEKTMGGHSFLVVGALRLRTEWHLLLQNVAWGPSWGFDGGFCLLSERFLENHWLDGYSAKLACPPAEKVKELPAEVVPIVLTPKKEEPVVPALPEAATQSSIVESFLPPSGAAKPKASSVLASLLKEGGTQPPTGGKKQSNTRKVTGQKEPPQSAAPPATPAEGEEHVE